MMKITLIYVDFMKGAMGKYYEGIASISAMLKNNGHMVKLFHITKYISYSEFVDIFNKEYGDSKIAMFSANAHTFYHVANYAKELKKNNNNILTICGGVHPTLCTEDSIRETGIDIVCIGEGEYPMLELCSALESNRDIYHIQNLWIKKEKRVIKNTVRPIIENLDSLPMPDRAIFNYDISMDRKWNRLVFIGSRGCPFRCAHCCNHALKEVYPNPSSYVRFKSPDKFIEEIKYYLNKYQKIEYINFQDDIFTLNKDWFKKFIFKYCEEIHLPYICNSRFDLMDAEILDILKNTGCIKIGIGLESGDDFIRKDVLGRKQNKEHIIRIGKLCKERGIEFHVYTMVGIPFENMRKVLKTIKLIAKLNPTTVQTSIYYPYPRTILYDICKKNGFLTEKRLDSYFERDSILNLPDFSKDEIIFTYDNFYSLVSIYKSISKLPCPLNLIFEKLMDLLWLTKFYVKTVISLYYTLRRIYRLLISNCAGVPHL